MRKFLLPVLKHLAAILAALALAMLIAVLASC